jgi:hypothetical protein
MSEIVERYEKNGELHREDGLAIIYSNGRQEWYLNGRFHREDGPALIKENGSQSWWVNGKLHREDGPAIIYDNGTQEWYLNGVEVKKNNNNKEVIDQIKSLLDQLIVS